MLNVRVARISHGGIGFPGFPEWMGKNSARRKRDRLLSEIAIHMGQTTPVSRRGLRMDYLCTLKHALLQPLIRKGKDAILDTVDMLDAYGLSREDFIENFTQFQFTESRQFPDWFKNYQLPSSRRSRANTMHLRIDPSS